MSLLIYDQRRRPVPRYLCSWPQFHCQTRLKNSAPAVPAEPAVPAAATPTWTNSASAAAAAAAPDPDAFPQRLL